MKLPPPLLAFPLLSFLGLLTLWGSMALNGTLIEMFRSSHRGTLPSGAPLLTQSLTGIFPVDFLIGLLLAFFTSLVYQPDLPDLGPYLHCWNLMGVLVVVNHMTLVEDRRSLNVSSGSGRATIPENEAQALPLSAIWTTLLATPFLLPSLVPKWNIYHIQSGILLWLLGPLTVSILQNILSSSTSSSLPNFRNPIRLSYDIVGTAAGIIHLAALVLAFLSSDANLTLTRIWIPHHDAPIRESQTYLLEGCHLFIQWDYIVVTLSILMLGIYILHGNGVQQLSGASAAPKNPTRKFLIVIGLFGPGAALAWLLNTVEKAAEEAERRDRPRISAYTYESPTPTNWGSTSSLCPFLPTSPLPRPDIDIWRCGFARSHSAAQGRRRHQEPVCGTLHLQPHRLRPTARNITPQHGERRMGNTTPIARIRGAAALSGESRLEVGGRQERKMLLNCQSGDNHQSGKSLEGRDTIFDKEDSVLPVDQSNQATTQASGSIPQDTLTIRASAIHCINPNFKMPSAIRSLSSSSSSGYDGQTPGGRGLPDTAPSSAGSEPDSLGLDDNDYPAKSFPGYNEKPLHEQLEPIAVIGMGCRLPGDVKSASAFWDLMMSKGTGQTPKVPKNRFNIDAHIHSNNDRPGSFGVLGGYFLQEELHDFDPGLFNITPVEAMWMDPQQRKLLEVVYEALESGGIPLERIAGTKTAVFAASFTADWQQMAFKEHSFRHSLAATGVDPGIISNRISHVFNLSGPSILCNTACSSSVYALHNACNALRNKEAEGAIVGGVNLIITVDQHMNTAKLGVLSPTSICHTFDASADGYGRADAVGAVYLKRLSDAIRDGDPIRGVIRSSATNSNGKVPGNGITHPNRDGQAEVIAAAYKRGGDLDPRLTGYFECHGTGTAVGDPLEVHAVSMAMNQRRNTETDDALWIGAVKTNIGHSEAASGISALIKAILISERGVIPATRGVVNPSKAIKWDEWQVRVPTDAVPFPEDLPVRRISINSFGYGGTNAHIIVEGTDSVARVGPAPYTYIDKWGPQKRNRLRVPGFRRSLEKKRPYLLPFSAHDKATLRKNIVAHGEAVSQYSLLDLSFTLGTRRSNLSSKAYTVASYGTLANIFDTINESFSFADKKSVRSLAFVFTGQGAQWARMGAELIDYCPSFLRTIRELDSVLGELHDGPEWTIEDVLLESTETSSVNDAEFSQPLCTAVQIAVVQLLGSWGIKPIATVGHSSGEMAAAYAAGLVSADDAIIAAYYRGVVAKEVNTGGAMLAVGLGADAVKAYLTGVDDKVVVACDNSPALVTLSGDGDALETVQAKLQAANVFNRAVKTGGKAYHSHHMAPASERYKGLVREAKRRYQHYGVPIATNARMVSSVTNQLLPQGTVLDEDYWSRNLRSPVLFNQAVTTLLTHEGFSDLDVFVEVGPHSALAGPIKQIREGVKGRDPVEYVPTLIRNQDSGVSLLKTAGELFLRSYKPLTMEAVTSAYVDDKREFAGLRLNGKPVKTKGATIVDLPPYQWNYTRPFWAESRSSREQRLPQFARHDLLGQKVVGASLSEPTWRNVLRIRDLPWLKHHHLGGESVFPAAGYFSMAMEAITQLNELSEHPVHIESYVLRDVSIKTALVTPDDDDGIEVLLNMRPSAHSDKEWDWRVSSVDSTGVNRNHMHGSIALNTRPRGKQPRPVPTFPQRASGKAWNQRLREVGFDYGATFQDMDNVRFDGKTYQASCTTNINQVVDESLGESRYVLHPASIDSTLQLCIAAIYTGRTEAMDCGVVPVQVDEIAVWPPTKQQLETKTAVAYANVHKRGLRTSESTVQMTSAHDGEMVMEIVNMRATAYEAAVPQKAASSLEEEPYGEMAWELDVDMPDNLKGLDTPTLVKLALFKYPGSHIVEAGLGYASEILQKNPEAFYTVVVSSEDHLDSARAVVEGYRNAKAILVDFEQDLEAQGLKQGSFDIVIGGIHGVIKPGAGDLNDEVTFASPVNTGKTDTPAAITLIYRKSPHAIVSKVKSSLTALGWSVTAAPLSAIPADTKNAIVLADFEGPLLLTLTEEEFIAVQALIGQASTLLWVSTGGTLQGRQPEFALVSGLARAVTAEQASIDFRVLDVDTATVDADTSVASVSRIASLQIGKTETEFPEREFAVSGSKTYISRLIRNKDLSSLYTSQKKPSPSVFWPGSRIAALINKGKVVFQQQLPQEVKPGHVEVEVHVSGLTKEGVLSITGNDFATTSSLEIGGVVSRVGPNVKGLSVGDKVVAVVPGHFDSYAQVPTEFVFKLTDAKKSLTELVPALTAVATSYYGLEFLARLRKGENILVLNKTGFVGVAAIVLAKQKGANVFAVAHSDDEVSFLQTVLGLDAHHIIRELEVDGNSALPASERMQQLTGGKGADVVFSAGGSVDALAQREAWRTIAPFGRFLDSGRKGTAGPKVLDGIPVSKNALYLPYDILDIYEQRPELLAEILPAVINLVTPPGPIKQISLGEIDSAVSGWSDSFGAAKAVIEYKASPTPIQVLPAPSADTVRFRPDATYLLVGCLGGLGRSLTSWMMERGAKRFTFLSRSGADAESAAMLVASLEKEGAIVQVVRGDVTDAKDVARAVAGIPAEHPIKGVVHAAMVLRDGLFHSMTYKDWKQSTSPKVLGAQNLHSVLANTPLDFFLMTSSVSGILGTPGQSNYAAANAFLDSLARHRHTRNQAAATSVVLPMVLGVGVVAENDALEDSLKRKGMYGIDEQHLLQSFEASIASSSLPTEADHVVVGLDPAKLQKALEDSAEAGDSFWLKDSRFSHVVHSITASSSSGDGAGSRKSILAGIKAAESVADATQLINEHFVDKLARMLMLSPEDVDAEVGSIASYGIDSMIGAELRNWIFTEFAMDVPFQQLLGPTLTISKFAATVCETHAIVDV
ncbi:polyketide synthase [Podospora australis]|uniref:Polyketide synthase n=1 Tax=Podospora australis TaxID=1536484 RepID=A0AAN7AEK0_9PEZI|nr:polyketide synthase [Podospora australis]